MKEKKHPRLPVLIFLVLILFSCSEKKEKENVATTAPHKVYLIKGSETARPAIEKILEKFGETNKDVYINYDGGGSNLGIGSLKNGEADMAFVSRGLTKEEEEELSKKNTITDFAFDGILIVVNSLNPVKQLSLQQLQNIYSGKTKNWKELGGNDMPIVLFSRDINSGTYSFFKEHVMFSTPFSRDDINLTHNNEITKNIVQTPGAIGYVGHADIEQGVKALLLSKEDGGEFVEPNFANIKYLTYPLARKIICVFPKNPEADLKIFLDYLKGQEARQITTDSGLLPVE
ncbi:MAG: phosphate ABC transporter substrate-binding protein [Bacteroidia bacterium]|nr:phosphate ABC transporter substrate-binding protein [Bacteroidia bacterium]